MRLDLSQLPRVRITPRLRQLLAMPIPSLLDEFRLNYESYHIRSCGCGYCIAHYVCDQDQILRILKKKLLRK